MRIVNLARAAARALRAVSIVGVGVLAGAAPAGAQALDGVYLGLGPAEGMRLEIERDGDRYEGALIGADGTRRAFEADAVGVGAETVIGRGTDRDYFRAMPEPAGATVVLAPFTEAGALDAGAARAYAFLREGVAAPPQPRRYLPPPAGPVAAFDARAFVDSYPFWEPMAAAWGYAAVPPRLRTVIRLYPLVQTDLLSKLCLSPQRTEGLAEALRGQGVTCQQVNDAMRRIRSGPAFNRYVAEVAAEREALMLALRCAENYARNDRRCAGSAEETARRAISMQTAQTVLDRFR